MKRVLCVGQCGFDHGQISRAVQGLFDTEVTPSSTAEDALVRLRQQAFDLVLVNREFDANGSSGLDFIQMLKSDPAFSEIPVMLVTNYRDVAEQAVSMGAVPGFGKSVLHSPQTIERLRPFLES